MSKTTSRAAETGHEADPFRLEASKALSRLIRATRAVIRALPARPANAASLTRELGLTQKAGWQLFRLTEAAEPLGAIGFVPGHKPYRDAVERTRAKGVAGRVADDAIKAYAEFESCVRRTAGDLTAFVSMLGGAACQPGDTADADRQHRLSAFKAYSHFCGMQVDLSADLDFVTELVPGERTSVSVRTVTGLRRFHAGAQCVVDQHRSFNVADPTQKIQARPLDAAAFREHGVPVLPAFCSHPMPDLMVTYDESDPNRHRIEWASGKVGIATGSDITTGSMTTFACVLPGDQKEHGVRLSTKVGYPAKRMTKTWLVRMPFREVLPPRLFGYLDPMAMHSDHDRAQSPKLYTHASIEAFATGSWNRMPKNAPVNREQIAYVCAIMGWDPAEFALYTLTIDYPLMHSVIIVEIPWI